MTVAILAFTHILAVAIGQLAGIAAHRADAARLRRRAILAETRCGQLGRELFMERTRPENIDWGSEKARTGLERLAAEIRSQAIIDLRERP